MSHRKSRGEVQRRKFFQHEYDEKPPMADLNYLIAFQLSLWTHRTFQVPMLVVSLLPVAHLHVNSPLITFFQCITRLKSQFLYHPLTWFILWIDSSYYSISYMFSFFNPLACPLSTSACDRGRAIIVRLLAPPPPPTRKIKNK